MPWYHYVTTNLDYLMLRIGREIWIIAYIASVLMGYLLGFWNGKQDIKPIKRIYYCPQCLPNPLQMLINHSTDVSAVKI